MSEGQSIQKVLDQLAAEGFAVAEDHPAAIAELAFDEDAARSPWYIRVFVGLSAWIAAVLFIAFLFIAEIITSEEAGLVIGIIFCGIAVWIHHAAPKNDFLSQLAMALSLSGQLVFTIGLGSITNETIPTALGVIVLEFVLLFFYKNPVHQLLSTLFLLGAVLAIIFDVDVIETVHAYAFLLGAGFIWLHTNRSRLVDKGFDDLSRPTMYGVAVFLLGLLVMPLLDDFDIAWWPTAVLLAALLVFLIVRVVTGLGLKMTSGAVPWLLAGCAVLLVPSIRMPGILGALIVLIAGFWRGNRLLIGFAALFLVFYLGAYYYSLEWTLLVKSLVLMGTGATLFLLRFILLKYAAGGQS